MGKRLVGAWRALRFRLWVLELRFKFRAVGARLEVEAPWGATLEGKPLATAFALGEGSGVFVLRIGRDVRIGNQLRLDVWAHGNNELTIGDGCLFEDQVRIVLRSGTVRMGDRVNVRDGSRLKSDGVMTIGSDVQISQQNALHCDESLTLGDWVGFAERVTILDSDHGHDGSDVHFRDQPLRVEPTEVGDNTFAAAGAVILRGARIGPNSLVAANAVVRGGDYPPASVLGGIPAKVLATRQDP